MSTIKQLSVYRDNNWQIDDIGADVGNITLNSTASLTDILPVITLTPNKALVSDSSGIIAASSVTSTELGYLSGTTSGIQMQINTLNANFEDLNDYVHSVDQTVSAASGTYATFTSITLDPGIYTVSGYVTFEANATGVRRGFVSSTESSTNVANGLGFTVPAVSGESTQNGFTSMFQLSSSHTVYFKCMQNSGSTLSCRGRLYYRKIRSPYVEE